MRLCAYCLKSIGELQLHLMARIVRKIECMGAEVWYLRCPCSLNIKIGTQSQEELRANIERMRIESSILGEIFVPDFGAKENVWCDG